MKNLYATIYLKGSPDPSVVRRCAANITNASDNDVIVSDDILKATDEKRTYIIKQQCPINGFSEYLVIDDRMPKKSDSAAALDASKGDIHVFARDDSFIDEAFVLKEYKNGEEIGFIKFNESDDGMLTIRPTISKKAQ